MLIIQPLQILEENNIFSILFIENKLSAFGKCHSRDQKTMGN